MRTRFLMLLAVAAFGCGVGGSVDGGTGGGAATGGGSATGGGTATGGGGATGGGSGSACAGGPFGIFDSTLCDGGSLALTLTFFSDGGASIHSVDTGACGVDRVACELLVTCGDAYTSQLSLDWTPADERLAGTWLRDGNTPACVRFEKL